MLYSIKWTKTDDSQWAAYQSYEGNNSSSKRKTKATLKTLVKITHHLHSLTKHERKVTLKIV